MPAQDTSLYFIAIVPPEPLKQELWNLKEYFQHNYNSKASLNSPAHITLHMPFDWKVRKEQDLIDGLSRFSANRKGFEVQLEGFGSFEPRVIFIHVNENQQLTLLHDELMKFCKLEFNLFNARYKDQAYHPHVTLAFRDLRKPMFQKAWEEFRSRPFNAKFSADRFCLLKHNGKTWDVFREFSLA